MRVHASRNRMLVPRQQEEPEKVVVVRANPPMKIRIRNWIITSTTANMLFLILISFLLQLAVSPSYHHDCGFIALGDYNFICKMSIMYQNKIVKDQGQESSKNNKQTNPFASKKQRFNYKADRSPGPGAYDYRTTDYKTPQYHVQKNVDKQSPIKREHQWIWGSGRMTYVRNDNYSTYIGPGSYNVSKHEGGDKSKTNWGKSERFQAKNGQATTLPGPGSYQSVNENKKSQAVSIFKSKSPRSFIQKLISESSMPDLRKSQVQQFIQNPEMGPQQPKKSQINEKSENIKSLAKSPVFVSKIPRFMEKSDSNTNIGPGSYELPQITKDRSHEKLPKIVIIKGSDKKKPIVQPNTELRSPGPGSYQVNLKTIEKQLQSSKKSIVICNEARFTQKVERMPGPGHYMENRNAYRAQFEKNQKGAPEKPSFNTSSDRSQPELPSKNNPLCAYNLQYFDLQYRVKKSQEHIEKLKIMEVTIPAFNSKARR